MSTLPVRLLRTPWRRLTSMRTALILLFLLALGAVPGSLLPQRPLDPTKTSNYITSHGAWGTFLDRIGMFDVFGSVWFAAIYLLLFISLVGCLIPRIRVHARAVARKPLPAPRNLSKLPESGRFDVEVAPDTYAASARETLGRRWRVAERREDGGVVTLSAEKGYSRETGNLVFHVALLVALVLIAIGRLYTYEGLRIVDQGTGYCNNVGNYDTWKPGRFAAEGKVTPAPFCLNVDKFTATYSSSGEPREFAAKVAYQTYQPDGTKAATKRSTISVNHPLRLKGDRVYLTGHGYAPTITVRMPNGTTQTRIADFLPTNATTLYSEGVYKIPGNGSTTDIGISGFFAPSPVEQANGSIGSSSAKVDHPVLGVFVYEGNLNATGLPESVYSLDHSKMKQIGAENLVIGQTKTLSNGVQITFNGWTPWVNLQVSHDPAQGYLLGAALAMVIGLAASLGVRRRRVWLRVGPDDTGATLVRVGGLARSDSGNFTGEFATLLERLRAAGSTATTTSQRLEDRDVIHAGKD